MVRRMTFVLCKHLLFARGLKAFLQEREEIEVVGIETDESRAMDSIRALKPDIVLVETGEEGVRIEELLYFVVRESPESRIVGLSLGQNDIDVYYGYHKEVRKAEDLLDVISELWAG